ncbi:aminoglycoside phosphotransferase family protein [Pseudodesulfovibrio sp. S3]|uniref:aminoglycoside phosphotransferase family protein n=2 Tax=unclassified Pseudodesulfovibrio TaxID=2661612 RepID=UPI0013E2F954|nr:aminoglycoside phosphotransferase family protein [Pseudodesulfovibrio sp. S3]MCJ2164138.1 aminoglycoside phosphotransferase family protein [Pseudodesulfovibrio sp. S3-i]
MWIQENGHQNWTDIQALAYGPRIGQAEAFPGALAFFEFCQRQGIDTCIVSHKTEFAASDPDRTCNLCTAAMSWLEKNSFFSAASSLTEDKVYFASTRQKKVDIIKELGCDMFIDDLIEVFVEPGYPGQTEQILFFPKGVRPEAFTGTLCTHWDQMIARLDSNVLDPALKPLVEAALDVEITGASAIGGGRNSRVFRIETEHGPFALKHYHDQHRLDAEFAAFAFLQGQGVTLVPEPVALDRDNRFAVYSFLQGGGVSEVTDQDIHDCIAFIKTLRELSGGVGAGGFGPAAEAFFRLIDIEKNIRDRVARLAGRARISEMESRLEAFLQQRFLPAVEEMTARARAVYADMGLAVDFEIPASNWILSPSDFGFHNAIRTESGLAFLDFEYFGWDDPAKLISDFLLHPGMDVSLDLRESFGRGVLAIMDDPALERRLGVLLPLFGLKWCMILLNEFLKTDFDRRRFAGATDARSEVLEAQLAKAERMLRRARAYAQSEIILIRKG